jgi:GTP-binding protein HflX
LFDCATSPDKTQASNLEPERALLVSIQIKNKAVSLSPADIEEFSALVESAGVLPAVKVTGQRQMPSAAHFVGKGKLEELAAIVEAEDIDVVLFNHELSPIQERNLSAYLKRRVLDRTGVILDIFAQRARSFEGKLQVELAQLKRLSTRLIRGWTHLERQKGGIGMRGPGETQLETDRRLIGLRIKHINKRLVKVNQRRLQNRHAREQAEIPTVALVGYTNAGKSSLFNYLTKADVYAADQLFATLDPTLRRLDLSDQSPVVLADTVGFVQNLPHDLVAAFRATLDETYQADLLLHVIDSADPERRLRIRQVNEVLSEIGADHIPQILVYNKIDKLTDTEAHIEYNADQQAHQIWLSAQSGEGMALLDEALRSHLSADKRHYQIQMPAQQAGKLRAKLHALGQVLDEQFNDEGDVILIVNLDKRHLHLFANDASITWQYTTASAINDISNHTRH